MEHERYLEVVLVGTARLAEVVGRDPSAAVARYPTWTVADLARHVGAVHRWVTGIVTDRAQQRPDRVDGPTVADDELPGWLERGADELVATLRDAPRDAPLWTFGEPRTVAFWFRRMALETTIHRWDAEDAIDDVHEIDPELGIEGIDEALHVYLGGRTAGTDVGGRGQRLRVGAADTTWIVTLNPDGVEVARGDQRDVDATVRGTPHEVWLFTMGRCTSADVGVDGDVAVADLCRRTVDLVPGPA